MPTFTAIALDRFLEPGASKAVVKRASVPIPKPPDSSASAKLEERRRGSDCPNGHANANNSSTAQNVCHFAQISPALYATPEATPLPDSPSSFPPSPYIINHKRRGPRLLNSFSQDSVPSWSPQQVSAEVGKNVSENEKEKETCDSEANVAVPASFTISSPSKEEERVDVPVASGADGTAGLGAEDLARLAGASSERDTNESSTYYDPQESLSYASYTDGEDNAEWAHYNATVPEFYDAWEEISSEGGTQTSVSDVEADMREIRLTLLVEIEKRKQAEETLNNMQNQWRRIVQHLSVVGLTVPSDLSVLAEGNESHTDIGEELGRQVYLARLVSESVGRGTAKAEMEIEMEAQIESKNLEIARLLDRLHYYEAVNREMSKRNQETIELTRRVRQRKKRRQRWYWGMVTTAITFGTGALAWSYLATEKGSSSGTSISYSQAPEEK